MWIDLLLLALGLALLLGGGHHLVRGASQLARNLGISELVVGLTVVAFGTSAPELSVNLLAAASDTTDICFGNVVGSNVANVGLILGLTALLAPLRIESRILSREIPMMLLATAAALVLGLDRLRGTAEAYDRSDGLVLLLLFAVFLYYTVAEVAMRPRTDPLLEEAGASLRSRLWCSRGSGLLIAGGLVGLSAGAHLTVTHASSLAEGLGVPRAIIGFSLVALGTSLPELATSLLAARAGQADLAVGNVVGSNIFNLLFILGTTCVLRTVELPAGGVADLVALGLVSGALLPLSLTHGSRIVRWEGALLLAAYGGYMTWRFAS